MDDNTVIQGSSSVHDCLLHLPSPQMSQQNKMRGTLPKTRSIRRHALQLACNLVARLSRLLADNRRRFRLGGCRSNDQIRLRPGNGDIMSKACFSVWIRRSLKAGLGCLLLARALSGQAAPLTAGEPILLENTKGNFDFIQIDPVKRRLLLAHTGNKTLDIFDLDSRHLLKSVPTGAAQDSAVDVQHDRYYVSVSEPPKMVIVDASKLEITGEVPLPAAADLMTYNPANGLAYVCNDTAAELWVIDPAAKKIVSTIKVSSGRGMEGLTFDPQYKRLFQVVSGNNTLFVIDPANNQVLESWPVLPAARPHGVALVPDADTLLVAGGTGKVALVNRSTGKVLASADVDNRVDEIAYDPELHLAYCPGGSGKISVIGVQGDKLAALGEVPGTTGRSVVLDPKTHTVWLAFSKGEQCFVQPFASGK
jgi:WD40 repeat protein